MRKAILASMFLAVAVIAFGQHGKSQIGGKTASKSKQKPKPTPSPKPNAKWETYTPCGVYYKDIDDFISDMDKGWRSVADTKDDHYWYNSDTERCGDGGVLKVWIKIIPVSYRAGGYSLTLYELKCTSAEL